MQLSTFQFESKEDREMAFNNIVKWFGPNIAKRVEILELTIQATQDVFKQTAQIAEKHRGRIKLAIAE